MPGRLERGDVDRRRLAVVRDYAEFAALLGGHTANAPCRQTHVLDVDDVVHDRLAEIAADHDERQSEDGAVEIQHKVTDIEGTVVASLVLTSDLVELFGDEVQAVEQRSRLHDQRIEVEPLEDGVRERPDVKRKDQAEDCDEETHCDLAGRPVPHEGQRSDNHQLTHQLEQLIPPAARLVREEEEAQILDRLALQRTLAIPLDVLHRDVSVRREVQALLGEAADQIAPARVLVLVVVVLELLLLLGRHLAGSLRLQLPLQVRQARLGMHERCPVQHARHARSIRQVIVTHLALPRLLAEHLELCVGEQVGVLVASDHDLLVLEAHAELAHRSADLPTVDLSVVAVQVDEPDQVVVVKRGQSHLPHQLPELLDVKALRLPGLGSKPPLLLMLPVLRMQQLAI
mmetsp:Transcript_46414/g.108987  ORF Transcript_46414/g.108987 Transcript_46414/m.108987 type:complete len:401 (+) Transcript_46414:578-1780(+)